MLQMKGKYQQHKTENLDDYLKAVGMPYVARKMVSLTSPEVDIQEDEGTWHIKQSTMVKTSEIKFKLNEQFDEDMPGGLMKSTATLEDNKLVIVSVHEQSGTKVVKTYIFDDPEYQMVILMNHEKSGQTAKRFFKKVY